MTDYRLWPATSGPAVAVDTSSTDLGVQFKVTSSNSITFNGYWRWSGTGQDTNGTHYSFKLFSTANGTTGSLVTGTSVTGVGTWTVGSWYYTPLSVPVTLVSGTTYMASVTHTTAANHYPATDHYWDSGAGSAGITNGPLTAPGTSTALGGIQCGFNEPSTGAIPSHVFLANNYWIDISVTVADGASAGSASSGSIAYNTTVQQELVVDVDQGSMNAVAYDATVAVRQQANVSIVAAIGYDVTEILASLSGDILESTEVEDVEVLTDTDVGAGVDDSPDQVLRQMTRWFALKRAYRITGMYTKTGQMSLLLTKILRQG